MECNRIAFHGGRLALGVSPLHPDIGMMAATSSLAFLYATWCLYVLTMGLYRAHLARRLSGINKVLALPVVLFAYALDALSNLLIATALFMDWPREVLLTTRLIRYKREDIGWRGNIADHICEHILDVFDPTGDHC